MDQDTVVKRWRFLAAVFYGVSLIVCVLGGLRFDSNIEDVFQWLPDDTSRRDQYDRYVDRFGTDDFLIVTWPGCELGDQRLDRFETLVESMDSQALIARVDTSHGILRKLVREYRVRATVAVERLRGLFVGRSNRQACAVLTLTPHGMDRRRDALRLVKSVCDDELGISPADLILAGYPVVGDYGDKIVRRSLSLALGPCCVLSTIVAWLCLRNFWLTLAIFATGSLAAGLSIAVVTLSGAKWGALSSVIPALAYLLSLSNSLHLINYARSTDQRRLIFRVFAIGWKPCMLSALTTAAGMLSLCFSDYPAIRQFGVFCAAGVLGSLACQLILMPVLIDLTGETKRKGNRSAKLERLFDFVAVRPTVFVLIFLTVSGFAAAGLTRLRSDLQVERNFSSNSKVMQDIARLEDSLGPVEQTELIIQFSDVAPEKFLGRVRAVEQVEKALGGIANVHTVYSAAAWLPEEPKGRGIRATATRAIYRDRIKKSRGQIAESAYLSVSGRDEWWRISLRFSYFGEMDFTRLDEQVRAVATERLNELEFEASVQHTGVVLLYYVAQDQLVGDLLRNFSFAFLAITPLMIIVLRSLRRGLIAMIPNLCPAAISYGVLGWVDYPVDIGMVMAACVGLGIAVDDTTHFMLRVDDLQRDRLRGSNHPDNGRSGEGDPTSVLRIAYRQCARAMLHTTLISGLGLTAFLPGELIAMTRFTWLLLAILVVALLCDLILLPALLLTMGICEGEDFSEGP